MNWFQKFKQSILIKTLKKAALKLSGFAKKLTIDDLQAIEVKVIELSKKDMKPLDKAAEAVQWAADKFFNSQVSFVVRTVVQIAYTVARIQGNLANKSKKK